ncbi:hypothetical protein [Bacillus sp. Marseille-P3800]|uniref:hypothetical protein n=1 Tax=Bacillus sp. Marseille-P3800 TaxID=2014782 RepID=UPI000C077447|nr:hypothetical protein [Bacillus sp. Marseille-P3800]
MKKFIIGASLVLTVAAVSVFGLNDEAGITQPGSVEVEQAGITQPGSFVPFGITQPGFISSFGITQPGFISTLGITQPGVK